eukprot:scaffold1541_cov256-Pinguiococcus_pyrenoidosus.AAC.19
MTPAAEKLLRDAPRKVEKLRRCRTFEEITVQAEGLEGAPGILALADARHRGLEWSQMPLYRRFPVAALG